MNVEFKIAPKDTWENYWGGIIFCIHVCGIGVGCLWCGCGVGGMGVRYMVNVPLMCDICEFGLCVVCVCVYDICVL